jgi:hypothetical protein
MKKLEWKDISSHSQRATDRTPKSWETVGLSSSIVVTRHIHYGPDVWIMRHEILGEKELKSKDIDSAKLEAQALVISELITLTGELV